ncbi:MAG TPA: DNA mismatch repair endonuclease MutL [Terriglobia bacterium]|nr:DNA mismatch repair endonuclease MutL [Terriglobia bacterium]
MSVIHILPDRVANQIAAGEVVERPASVVKELLENSLDAGGARLEVEVEAGGKRLIRVTDDGCGMIRDDALLAFERHATSKIRQAEDLLEIATLGFRGEALPSIAAVSRVVLETRNASEAAGTRVEIAAGNLRDVKEIAWPHGTRIEARDLFFNTPARRKFLKSESTELGHIASLVTHYALAHPEKSFRLTSMSHEVVNAPPAPDARTRVYQLLGVKVLEQLIEFGPVERRLPAPAFGEVEENEAPEAPGVVRVTGFVSRPEVQRLNRNEVFFFVNRRLVRDRLILHAITEAYRNILPPRMFPVALVFLESPPQEVDVNVHPSKTEVRFRRTSFVHDVTRDAIRQALIAARPVAAFPLRRTGAEPVGDDLEALEKLAEEAPAAGPEAGERLPGAGVVEGAVAGTSLPHGAERPNSRAFSLTPPKVAPAPGVLPLEMPSRLRPEFGSGLRSAAEAVLQGPAHAAAPEAVRAGRPGSCEPTDAAVTMAAVLNRTGGPPPATLGPEFPADLRPLGQVEESYIVATNAAGLWIVDQHAAHERVLFEKHLRQVRAKQVEAQRLLLPIIIELKPQQQAVFEDIADELRANGFEVEPFGQRTVAVKTAPAELAAEDVERLLVEILDGVGQDARGATLEVLRGRISASLACRAAIKIHMALDRPKMEWLLGALARAESPMACPHGRPVMLRYTIRELERAFHRT